MELQTEDFELETAQKEYGHFFVKCERKYLPNSLHIITAEQKSMVVKVSILGWSLINDTKAYETFEALMMNVSAGFQASFSSLLSAKLVALSQERAFTTSHGDR